MIAWLRLSLRRLRDARAAALTLGLFVLATAFVTAAAPRALDAAADGAFRHELLDARSSARNIALQHEGRLPGWRDDPADPYAGTAAVAAALEGRFPPEVAALIDERAVMVTTPRFSPWLLATPRPASRSSPLGSTSAATAITLAVPMSSPTMRSLYSLAMWSCPRVSCVAGCLAVRAAWCRVYFLRAGGTGSLVVTPFRRTANPSAWRRSADSSGRW